MPESLKAIIIENSTYCRADCVMCSRNQYEFKNRYMPFELFTKIIREAAELGIELINIGGLGDPLMDSNFLEKAKYAKEVYPHIQTMCTITADIINVETLEYIDVLNISHYGYTKQAYEAVHRGSLNFEEVRSNIQKVLDMPDGKRPYIHMKYLLLPENKHEFDDWKKYWETQNVDEIWCWKPMTWAGVYDYGSNIDYTAAKPCHRVFSLAPQAKINGMISLCCCDSQNELILGDINEKSLSEIFKNNKKLNRLREIHKNRIFNDCEFESCKNCDQITDRAHALVYSSGNRSVNAIALGEGREVR